MRPLKLLLIGTPLLFVGVPLAFILFVLAMAAFGVVFGIGMAIVVLLTVVKFALLIIIPIMLVSWLIRRSTERERTR